MDTKDIIEISEKIRKELGHSPSLSEVYRWYLRQQAESIPEKKGD